MNESFKALADPTRRKIIDLLKEQDRTAGELAEFFAMSKPSLSHHLNTLKHAGLIQDEREGQYIRYTLNMTVLQEVLGWVLSVTSAGSGSKNASENEKEERHS